MSAVRFSVAVWWQTTARTSLIWPRPRVSQPGTSITSRLVLRATAARSVRYGIVPPSGSRCRPVVSAAPAATRGPRTAAWTPSTGRRSSAGTASGCAGGNGGRRCSPRAPRGCAREASAASGRRSGSSSRPLRPAVTGRPDAAWSARLWAVRCRITGMAVDVLAGRRAAPQTAAQRRGAADQRRGVTGKTLAARGMSLEAIGTRAPRNASASASLEVWAAFVDRCAISSASG